MTTTRTVCKFLRACKFGNLDECIACLDDDDDDFELSLLKRSHFGKFNSGGLHVACLHGHLAVCELLIARHPNGVNKYDRNGLTPLMHACSNGHVKICRLLIEHGARVNRMKRFSSNMSLYIAANKGHMRTFRFLLANNASLRKAMYCAALDCNVQVCKLLLENGADANATERGSSTPLAVVAGEAMVPLSSSANLRVLEMCNLLLAHGASVHQTGGRYTRLRTPLFIAAHNGNLELCKLLIEKGGGDSGGGASGVVNIVDAHGMTPLLIMAEPHGYDNVFELLLENGADICARDSSGRTPYRIAIDWEHFTRSNAVVSSVIDKFLATVAAASGDNVLCLDLLELLAHEMSRAFMIKTRTHKRVYVFQ